MRVSEVSSVATPQRLTPGLWIAAAAEIAVAIAVGATMLRYGTASGSTAGMSGAHAHHHSPQIHWSASSLTLAALTASALIWWAASRTRIPAALAAAGLMGVVACEPIRVLALQSHLIAMAELEVLLVAVPLLLIAALPRTGTASAPGRAGAWTAGVVIAVAIYGVFLITLHLPGFHSRAGATTMVPLWLAASAVAIGMTYWAAILLTAGHAAPSARRAALIVGQEVGVIIGLAALFVPSPVMGHTPPLGVSSTMDQRLGGALMVLTCAAVTLPLARRLAKQEATQQSRTEHHVH
jgi:hypothetical protein